MSRSVGKDLNLPVLANILIEAKDGRLKFAGTNLEIGTICLGRGKIEKEGAITIPAQILVNYISNLPESNVKLVVEYSVLKVECENFSGEIKGVSASEFPLIPKIKSAPFCRVASSKLREALSRVVFAVARDETRPEISGVFISAENGKLRIAATDSYRLCEEVIGSGNGKGEKISIIVPSQTMQELARILDEGAGEVLMSVLDNQIKFVFGDIAVVSRLIEGQYPDYLRIIPKKFSTKIELEKNGFIKAIKTTSLFSRSDTNELRFNIDKEKNLLILQAESGQIGKNVSRIQGKIEGDDVDVVFNARYLLDGLNAMSGQKIKFLLLGSGGPGIIKDLEKDNYLYIVMPIKK